MATNWNNLNIHKLTPEQELAMKHQRQMYDKQRDALEQYKKRVYEAIEELMQYADETQQEVYMTFPTLTAREGTGLTYSPKGSKIYDDDPDWSESNKTRETGEWVSSSASC